MQEGPVESADWQTQREIIRALVRRVEVDEDQRICVVFRVGSRPLPRAPTGLIGNIVLILRHLSLFITSNHVTIQRNTSSHSSTLGVGQSEGHVSVSSHQGGYPRMIGSGTSPRVLRRSWRTLSGAVSCALLLGALTIVSEASADVDSRSPCVVSGKVVGADGLPIRAAFVRPVGKQNGLANTTPDGAFTLEYPGPGGYFLWCGGVHHRTILIVLLNGTESQGVVQLAAPNPARKPVRRCTFTPLVAKRPDRCARSDGSFGDVHTIADALHIVSRGRHGVDRRSGTRSSTRLRSAAFHSPRAERQLCFSFFTATPSTHIETRR